MENIARLDAYTAQNGRRVLTTRQRRRLLHKAGHNEVGDLALLGNLTRREAVKVVRSW